MFYYLVKRIKLFFVIQNIQIATQEVSLKGFPKGMQVSVWVFVRFSTWNHFQAGKNNLFYWQISDIGQCQFKYYLNV